MTTTKAVTARIPHLSSAAGETATAPTQHAFCTRCFPSPRQMAVALCGFEVTARVCTLTPDRPCVVCADVFDLPCPRCGAPAWGPAVVEAGERRWRVVYGGTRRLTPGDIVPVALPGTKLTAASGLRLPPLRVRNFRGVRSEAMLCSSDKLGWTVGGPDEVLVLDPGHEVGALVQRPSGRCHGPGCTQTAVVEDGFCGEVCQARWHGQFDTQVPGRLRAAAPVRPFVHVDLTGVQQAMGQALHEVSLLVHAVSNLPPETLAAAAGVMSPGMKAALAQRVDTERLTLNLRAVCPPGRLDDALAEVRRRASGLWRHEDAWQSVIDEVASGRLFASANAGFPQVASNSDPSRGWLSRTFDRLFGRTT